MEVKRKREHYNITRKNQKKSKKRQDEALLQPYVHPSMLRLTAIDSRINFFYSFTSETTYLILSCFNSNNVQDIYQLSTYRLS